MFYERTVKAGSLRKKIEALKKIPRKKIPLRGEGVRALVVGPQKKIILSRIPQP